MQIIKESLGSNTAAYLQGYLREKDPDNPDHVYPAMIVVPGGSYTHIPEQQAETLAMPLLIWAIRRFTCAIVLLMKNSRSIPHLDRIG